MRRGNQVRVGSAELVEQLLSYRPPAGVSAAVNPQVSGGAGRSMLQARDVCFYQVESLAFDEDYPRREAFENILLTLDDPHFLFVYDLRGDEHGIKLYIGVVRNLAADDGTNRLTALDYGTIIQGAFEGNFGGSRIRRVLGNELSEELLSVKARGRYEHGGMIVGVPSENDEQDEGKGFQGIDRLINSMMGASWRLVIVAQPAERSALYDWREEIYHAYNAVAPFVKNSVQSSRNAGTSRTTGTSSSKTDGTNFSKNKSNGGSKSHSFGPSDDSNSSGTNWSTGENAGESHSRTGGTNRSKTTNTGTSQMVGVEVANKSAQELVSYIDDELLPRMKRGFGRGMFRTSVYYMADQASTAHQLRAGLQSLFGGESSSYSQLAACPIDFEAPGAGRLVRLYQNVSLTKMDARVPDEILSLLSRPHTGKAVGLDTWLTADEVSLMAGMPQREIPGLAVTEGVEFGLNTEADGDVVLGSLVQRGRKLKIPFALARDVLQKHTFIAGVTGSGKTTTCQKILKEAGVPFLVIEPAKTEYRTLVESETFDDCLVFTVGDESVAPLRFNPFELVRGENLSSHIDMLKATFTSAFEMEASMPQLIEEAIYRCYEEKGWNADTSRNDVIGKAPGYTAGTNDEFSRSFDAFPTLDDFLAALTTVVQAKNFSERLRDDYIGSLVSRFSNLRKGTKGRMLNTQHSVPFDELLERNVIFELEDLRSAEDKSLLMGLLLARISSEIRKKHVEDASYRHVTLIEEAHRLLSRVEPGDGGAKRSAVETFADLLAEVRKYGEGLVIVDQIPNKLAPEVIKNTNTKIIHKLFARDDKETVGDAMLMDDKQKAYLSSLEPGEAIVFTEGSAKPVDIAVKRETDTNGKDVEDEVIRKTFERAAQKNGWGSIYVDGRLARSYSAELRTLLTQAAETGQEMQPQPAHTLAEGLHHFAQENKRFGVSSAEDALHRLVTAQMRAWMALPENVPWFERWARWIVFGKRPAELTDLRVAYLSAQLRRMSR